jgi:hypothetical protein
VAIGRRSIVFAADSFIARAIHNRVDEGRPDNNSGERRTFIARSDALPSCTVRFPSG